MAVSLLVNVRNYPPRELLVSSFYAFRWVAYAGLFFAIPKFNKRLLAIPVLVVAIVGIFQYLLMPDTTWLAVQNWDDHYFRLISTFLDPGFTGIILVLGILLIPNPLFFIAMLLTYSRASYLSYLAGFAAVSFYKRSVRIFIVAVLALAITVPFLPKALGEGTKLGRETSIWARINNWKQAVVVWQGSPVFGVGFNTYRYATGASPESHAGAGADSSLLLVLATTGIIGFLSYLGFLRDLWRRGNTLYKVSFAAVFVHSWFNNTLFYPWVMEWLWLLLILSRSNSQPDRSPSL